MFVRQELPMDTQLSPSQTANLLLSEALQQLQQLTNLSTSECEQLISEQFNTATKEVNKDVTLPIIEPSETEFITALFN